MNRLHKAERELRYDDPKCRAEALRDSLKEKARMFFPQGTGWIK